MHWDKCAWDCEPPDYEKQESDVLFPTAGKARAEEAAECTQAQESNALQEFDADVPFDPHDCHAAHMDAEDRGQEATPRHIKGFEGGADHSRGDFGHVTCYTKNHEINAQANTRQRKHMPFVRPKYIPK